MFGAVIAVLAVLTAGVLVQLNRPDPAAKPANRTETTTVFDPAPEPLSASGSFGTEAIWAQRHRVHVGSATFSVGKWMVVGLRPTAYGVFVDLSRSVGPDAGSSWYFFDHSRVRDLPASAVVPTAPVVSGDGRHAAWMDLAGPLRPAGRIAQLVVTNLPLLGALGSVDRGRFQTTADGSAEAFLSPSRRWTMARESDRCCSGTTGPIVGPGPRPPPRAPGPVHPARRFVHAADAAHRAGLGDHPGLGGLLTRAASSGRACGRRFARGHSALLPLPVVVGAPAPQPSCHGTSVAAKVRRR